MASSDSTACSASAAHAPPTGAILLGKAATTAAPAGATDRHVHLQDALGTRLGLIAGATGTGKTAALMTPTEGSSRLGVLGGIGRH